MVGSFSCILELGKESYSIRNSVCLFQVLDQVCWWRIYLGWRGVTEVHFVDSEQPSWILRSGFMRTLSLPEFRNRKFDLSVLSSEIFWTMLQFPSSDRTVTCVGVSRATVEWKKKMQLTKQFARWTIVFWLWVKIKWKQNDMAMFRD